MKIAILTHKVDLHDGQGRVNYEIALAALEGGHEVTVVAEYCSAKIAEHPLGRFVQMRDHPLPLQLLRNLYFAFKSSIWLRRHRDEFDVIQANGFVTWEPVDIVAVHFVHGSWFKNALFPFHWKSFSPYAYYQRIMAMVNNRYELKAFAQAHVLVAVSRFTASEVESLGIPRDKIVIVHNGVDVDEFYSGAATRSIFGLPDDVPMALFVGDIKTTRKNLGAVLTAMLEIPHLHLAVAGNMEGSPYPAIVEKLRLTDRVHFLGKTSSIPSLMRSVDFFVFPSFYEAHPLVLLEAMASGLPIIVSNNFWASDYLGGGGILLEDPNDARALAVAMSQMVSHPEIRKVLGVAAREQALKMRWSVMAQKYLNVYRMFLDGKLKDRSP